MKPKLDELRTAILHLTFEERKELLDWFGRPDVTLGEVLRRLGALEDRVRKLELGG